MIDQERDAGDYVNIRVNGGANGLIRIRKGMRLRVHGFLQSRDFRENLEEFLQKARRVKAFEDLSLEIKGSEHKPDQVQIDRNIVEIVAQRILVLDMERKAKQEEET